MPIISSTPRQEATQARSCQSSYVMSARELRHAAAAKEQYRFSLTTKIVMKIIATPLVFICACGLIILFRSPPQEFTQMFMAMYGIFLIISLVVLFHKTLFVILQSRRSELRKLIGKTFESSVSSNGIVTDAFGNNNLMPWKGFKNCGLTKHGLFLSLPNGEFHWLPASSFESDEAWQYVKGLALARLPKP